MPAAAHALNSLAVAALVLCSGTAASADVKEGAWDMQFTLSVRTGAEPYKVMHEEKRRECLTKAAVARITSPEADTRRFERDFGACSPTTLVRDTGGTVTGWAMACVAADGRRTEVRATNTLAERSMSLLVESTTTVGQEEATDVRMLRQYTYLGECSQGQGAR
jgi:hypothetical protein